MPKRRNSDQPDPAGKKQKNDSDTDTTPEQNVRPTGTLVPITITEEMWKLLRTASDIAHDICRDSLDSCT